MVDIILNFGTIKAPSNLKEILDDFLYYELEVDIYSIDLSDFVAILKLQNFSGFNKEKLIELFSFFYGFKVTRRTESPLEILFDVEGTAQEQVQPFTKKVLSFEFSQELRSSQAFKNTVYDFDDEIYYTFVRDSQLLKSEDYNYFTTETNSFVIEIYKEELSNLVTDSWLLSFANSLGLNIEEVINNKTIFIYKLIQKSGSQPIEMGDNLTKLIIFQFDAKINSTEKYRDVVYDFDDEIYYEIVRDSKEYSTRDYYYKATKTNSFTMEFYLQSLYEEINESFISNFVLKSGLQIKSLTKDANQITINLSEENSESQNLYGMILTLNQKIDLMEARLLKLETGSQPIICSKDEQFTNSISQLSQKISLLESKIVN